jgi:hypothetical protein
MSARRLIDMTSAAILMIGLGYVVAVSSHSLPGEDGGEALIDAELSIPHSLVVGFQWAILALAAAGALIALLSVARAARREEFDFKRFRVLIYWIIAFVLALQIRPPQEPDAGGAAPPLPALPGETPVGSGTVIAAGWVAGVLVVAVVVALVVRLVLARRVPEPAPGARVSESFSSGPLALAEPLAPSTASDPRGRILTAYAGFERGTLDAGFGRHVSETPRGHAVRAGRELDLQREALDALEEGYEAVRFGELPVTSEDAEAAESAWARLRGRLGR